MDERTATFYESTTIRNEKLPRRNIVNLVSKVLGAREGPRTAVFSVSDSE